MMTAMDTVSTANAPSTPEAEIRDLLDSYGRAVLSGDVDAILSYYTDDIVAYDAIGDLRFHGLPAYRQHWEMCLSFMKEGPPIYDIHEAGISASERLAFVHYLVRCGDCDQEGRERSGWMRGTACLRREEAGWRIAHEHFSVPFDPSSEKVRFDRTL